MGGLKKGDKRRRAYKKEGGIEDEERIQEQGGMQEDVGMEEGGKWKNGKGRMGENERKE